MAEPRGPRLRFVSPRRLVALPAVGERLVIGRGSACDVVLSDPHVSRSQAEIEGTRDGWIVRVLGGSAPTWIDGEKLEGERELADGTTLAFGEAACVVELKPRGAEPGEDTLLWEKALAETELQGARAGSRELPAFSRLEVAEGRNILGRSHSRATLRLDHPMVSREHAVLTRHGATGTITDLESANGTWVNGMRITAPTPLVPGDRVDLGPFSLTFLGEAFEQYSRAGNSVLVGHRLTRRVRDHSTGQPLEILRAVDVVLEPGEFVCLVGPSGCGKSTLMNALSARQPATSGQVLISGTDLYANFDLLKRGIALIPQHDLLHEELRLEEALTYTARLRLPPDTDREAIRAEVARALEAVELSARARTPIKMLSGGQKKRASLASEILSRPDILFLDEVTSGLDERTDQEMMRLLRGLADEGMSIVCVTHTLANVAQNCDLVAILAPPGVLTYLGPPKEACRHFGVEALSGIYEQLEAVSGEEWRERYEQTEEHVTYVQRRLERHGPRPDRRSETAPQAPQRGLRFAERWRQFRILGARFFRLTMLDRNTLLTCALQSIVVAVLLALVFVDIPWPPKPPNMFQAHSLLFLLGLSAFWFGCNNASREIVKERFIYRRERDVNLDAASYLASKIAVLTLLITLQITLLATLVWTLCDIPGGLRPQIAFLWLSSFAGTGAGLLISASARSSDQANTLVPIFLIPQIVLAGMIVPDLPEVPEQVARALISGFWMYDGMRQSLFGATFSGQAAVVLIAHAAVSFLLAFAVLVLRDRRAGGLHGMAVARWVRAAGRAVQQPTNLLRRPSQD